MTEAKIMRRPIKARDTRWAASVAAWLARRGVRPNAISVASLVLAGIAGLCLAWTGHATGGLRGWLLRQR
jgi:hypothetical protein